MSRWRIAASLGADVVATAWTLRARAFLAAIVQDTKYAGRLLRRAPGFATVAALTLAIRLNPFSYGVDGLRGALIGSTQFGVVTNIAVLGVVASGFLVLGAWAFSRIQV